MAREGWTRPPEAPEAGSPVGSPGGYPQGYPQPPGYPHGQGNPHGQGPAQPTGWGPPPGYPQQPGYPQPGPAQPPGYGPPQGSPPSIAFSERERRRESWIGGGVLIVIGGVLLAGQFVDDLGRGIPLIVGLVLLGFFLANRTYGLLVAGCIVTGVGAGVLLSGVVEGSLSGAVVLLSLGAGFAAIWPLSVAFRLPEQSPWGLIPGGILAGIGVLQWAGEEGIEIGSWWPFILIGLGVIVIARGVWRTGRRT